MNYKDRLLEAITYTQSLSLHIDNSIFSLDVALTDNSKQSIFQLCGDALYQAGLQSSSHLAGKCAPIHLMLKERLKAELGIETLITIGDRFWDDYVYCEMTKESVENELDSTKIFEPIKAHVWLTLSDGTILDCTAEAHADILFGRGEHPAHQCIMIVSPNKAEDAKTGYHRPVLVGSEFLEKTGMVQTVLD
ncbi:hypothetical protein [Pseudomonas sp. S2_H01]